MSARVDYKGRLTATEVAAVMEIVEAATAADGVRPVNEHAMLHLRYGGDEQARSALLYAEDGTPAAYAHVDPTDAVEGPSGELVVHPAYRGRGLGTALARAVLEHTGGRLRLWAHGGHPAAERLAHSLGFERVRSLWQMRRPLTGPEAAPLPAYELPPGVRLRTFRVGADEDAWVTLNARAFADHPEQGAWTLEDLKRREQEPWFDPEGFFLAVPEPPAADGQEPALLGFHWTKVHGAEGSGHGHEPLGEVYVVGVDPAQQGTGLGKALTLAGLHHLRDRGLAQVMLYVDEANTPAIRLYQGLGFTRWDTDVMYRAGE
ncbi:mycothiol synthase [Thermocatellispora tengchongensis]|uniref:Mycothiol acetyltransferase n=1 Tax=Thermocatellispora tengchongensis TaxID=1073253 RepID=A0A840PI77_9ACTN|nr:mycothiol synthase [Thermocatellispora tengchongensis]MBB5138842.1 mycothiol synthase [Thermocatellispora tengchongensis]